MPINICDIQNRTRETLSANPALAEYVKDFSVGEDKIARKIFPYVTVAKVDYTSKPLTIGRNGKTMYTVTITIQAGTSCLVPEIAHSGGETGKGIVQLCDDVVTALWPGNIGGIFERTMRLDSAKFDAEPGGRLWTGKIVLTGEFRA